VSDPRDQRIAELESRAAGPDAQLAAKDVEIADLKRKVDELTQLILLLKDGPQAEEERARVPDGVLHRRAQRHHAA